MSEQPETAVASTAAIVATKPDGLIDEWMSKIFGRSWRTSVMGLLALAVNMAPLIPNMPAQFVSFARDLGPLMLGGGLLLAKDARVSGQPK